MGIQDRDGKQKYFHRVKVQFFSQLSPFCIWKLNPLSAFVLFILVQMEWETWNFPLGKRMGEGPSSFSRCVICNVDSQLDRVL